MNTFLEQSLTFAQQRNYLDELYKVYPTIHNGIRDIDKNIWINIEKAYDEKNNSALIENLLDLELFPLKDSYVAFLKRDRNAIQRNPNTIKRLCTDILSMQKTELFEKCSEPKETNRQIGPMFNNWVLNNNMGFAVLDYNDFVNTTDNAILNATDSIKKNFAKNNLGYYLDKGIDFLARINNRYVIGEAKFITDFGGHQKGQFDDAIRLLNTPLNAIKVAILDGILYIKNNSYMYKSITTTYQDCNIMSALLLKNFLYTL